MDQLEYFLKFPYVVSTGSSLKGFLLVNNVYIYIYIRPIGSKPSPDLEIISKNPELWIKSTIKSNHFEIEVAGQSLVSEILDSESIIERKLLSSKIYSNSRTISNADMKIEYLKSLISEIDVVGWDNVSVFEKDSFKVTLKYKDSSNRTFFLNSKILYKPDKQSIELSCDILEKTIIDLSLQKFDGWLVEYYQHMVSTISEYRDALDLIDKVNKICYILPLSSTARSILKAKLEFYNPVEQNLQYKVDDTRFAVSLGLGDLISVDFIINKSNPDACPPVINVNGPSEEVGKINSTIARRKSKWNNSGLFIDNLSSLFQKQVVSRSSLLLNQKNTKRPLLLESESKSQSRNLKPKPIDGMDSALSENNTYNIKEKVFIKTENTNQANEVSANISPFGTKKDAINRDQVTSLENKQDLIEIKVNCGICFGYELEEGVVPSELCKNFKYVAVRLITPKF
ncbi:hypothetical protein BB560_002179 [Smittium megazygosporum]|uniref:Uncharacterized protein n=1 Tax=Smittium megazygosporum TaxID=133381 RepID=A0A2T9ZFH3_9FUNG|nr:hypothetical protein BB560_002179 [Smittium megazygosporum]